MVYINSKGEVSQSKPLLRTLIDLAFGIANGVAMFFRSLFNLDANEAVARPSGSGPRGPQPPRRKIAGLATNGGPGAPPCAPGGG